MRVCRNLLSNDKQHIDHITNIYGKQLMQAVVFILESENNPEVRGKPVIIASTRDAPNIQLSKRPEINLVVLFLATFFYYVLF